MFNFPVSTDLQRRLREQQRSDLLQWMVRQTSLPGIATGQTVTTAFLESLLTPAQSSIQAVLDDPSGERLNLTVHGNGSLVIEQDFDALDQLDAPFVDQALPQLSCAISDLFHADALHYTHALVKGESAYVLRTLSSVSPARDLTDIVAEALALKEQLMAGLYVRLTESGDAQ